MDGVSAGPRTPDLKVTERAVFNARMAKRDAVRVTAADFNGHDWDGSPFSAMPEWLESAVGTGDVVVHMEGHTDYCLWRVKVDDGEWQTAGPGDWIERSAFDGALHVVRCP